MVSIYTTLYPLINLNLNLAPSIAPVITNSSIINSTAVFIAWAPPPMEYLNGIITGYRVNVTAENTTETDILTFSSTNATIGSLAPSFTYYFAVTAYTVAAGPYSTTVDLNLPEDGKTIKYCRIASIHV